MARTARPKATDFTGRERERLIKENADAIKVAQENMSIITAIEDEKLATQVTDFTEPQPTIIDSVESVGVALHEEWEVIQVMEDLEQVTVGVGNNYDFKVGQKYKVPTNVANHLREKGYVWG